MRESSHAADYPARCGLFYAYEKWVCSRRKREIGRNPEGRPELFSWQAKVALVEDGRVGSLPARGRVTQFELRVAANVRVKKGVVTVQHRGKRLAPGWYEITEDGRVVLKKRLPKLKKG